MSTISNSLLQAVGFHPIATTTERKALVGSAQRTAQGPRTVSPELLAILRREQEALPFDQARLDQLNKLALPGCVVVSTGQQVGLFGGPLLTLLKALSAVATARLLEAETGVPTVPLFWIQSEDHDVAEVRTVTLLTSQFELADIALLEPDHNLRIPLGSRVIGEAVAATLESAEAVLKEAGNGPTVLEQLRASYRVGVTWSQAFLQYFARATEGTGLIFLDPKWSGIASLIAPTFRTAWAERRAITQALQQQSEWIVAQGKTAQVHVRANSPLWFVQSESLDSERYRIEESGSNTWTAVGLSADSPSQAPLASPQIEQWLLSEPQRFSSSALLRPLAQDSLLPVVAYVGGNAEQNYFLQLAPLYKIFGLPQPAFIPRAAFSVIDQKLSAWLGEFSLKPEDFRLPDHVLQAKLAKVLSSSSDSAEGFRTEFQDAVQGVFGRLRQVVEKTDPTLLDPLQKTEGKQLEFLENFLRKYERSITDRDVVKSARLKKLKNMIAPRGTAQDRILGVATFYARYGSALNNGILARFNPFTEQPQEILL